MTEWRKEGKNKVRNSVGREVRAGLNKFAFNRSDSVSGLRKPKPPEIHCRKQSAALTASLLTQPAGLCALLRPPARVTYFPEVKGDSCFHNVLLGNSFRCKMYDVTLLILWSLRGVNSARSDRRPGS